MIKDTVFVDLETTGVDLLKDKIVEIGIVYYDSEGKRTEFSSYINPKKPIPKEASDVHGITDKDVAAAPDFATAHHEILPMIRDAKYFCAYNFRFDYSILQKHFSDIGIELFSDRYIFIDPCLIFRKQVPHTLESAYLFYTGKKLENAHRALDDIKATEEVLIAQIDKHRDLFAQGLKTVQDQTAGDCSIVSNWFAKNSNGKLEFTKGKHAGEVVGRNTGHVGYLKWMSQLDNITPDDARIIRENI